MDDVNGSISIFSETKMEHGNRRSFIKLTIINILALYVYIKKLVLKVIGSTPRTNLFWFDGISIICRQVKENPFSWKALEIIYKMPNYKTSNLSDRITSYWNGLLNAMGVRNRLRITADLISRELESKKGSSTISILSIASGSARSVHEAIYRTNKKYNGISSRVSIFLLDLDESSHQYSVELMEKLSSDAKLNFLHGRTTDLELLTNGKTFDIIEMVGFLEYRPDKKAADLLTRIYNKLNPDGVFIFSQIAPNYEQFFLREVMNWPMIYRNKNKFLSIIKHSGIVRFDLVTDPTNLHNIAVARK